MSIEIKKEIQLEIAHVLFMDIVGYSKLLIDEQHALLETLNEIVRGSEQFRNAEAAGKLIKIPTGDGMALVFRGSPEEPVECALEISRALRAKPNLPLRMGIHSGPVSGVIDVNNQTNVAGAGINMAQRVMDCGDEGHILISKHVAEDLEQYAHWRPLLHDLGECEVKHGVRIGLSNLYSDEFGNSALPGKFALQRRHRAHVRGMAAAIGIGALLAIAAGFVLLSKKSTSPIPEKSIAVLPFENLSEDKSSAYFAAGIQDEILTRLASLRELKVISRTSTEKYPIRPQNLKTIGSELGVANILEGSVQKLANEAHINVQLINSRTDEHMWAQSYDRTLEHVFAVEGEVAQRVADALKLKLLPDQLKKLNALPTQNPQAYDLFLKGEYARDRAWKSGTYDEMLKPAVAYFREAVTLDPRFGLAFAQLAETQLTQYHFGVIDYSATRMPELLASAKDNIDRALRLDPDLPAAHVALGHWHYWGRSDYDAGLAEFKRALDVDPRLSEAWIGVAGIALRRGNPDEMIQVLSKALEVDPRNPRLLRYLGAGSRMRRDYARDVQFSSRAIALDPTSEVDAVNLGQAIIRDKGDVSAALHIADGVPAELQETEAMVEHRVWLLTLGRDFAAAEKTVKSLPHESWRTNWREPLLLADIQRSLGQEDMTQKSFQRAHALLKAAIANDSEEPMAHADLAYADSGLGLRDEALREADRAIALQPVEKDAFAGPQWLVDRAEIAVRVGRTDEAIKLLEDMIARPVDTICAWELKLDPAWDPLRRDSRFQKLTATEEAQETH